MALTKADLDIRLSDFEKRLETIIDGKLSEKLDEQEVRFEKKLTEFKSEFFTKIDPILKEVVTARKERPLIENRLEVLEEKVGIHTT